MGRASTMDMPGMPGMPGMGNGTMPGGMTMMMMQMWFTTGGWSKENSLTMLFSWWVSDSVGLYALTLLLVFGFGVLQEALAASNAHYSVRLSEIHRLLDEDQIMKARVQASLAHGLFVGWHF